MNSSDLICIHLCITHLSLIQIYSFTFIYFCMNWSTLFFIPLHKCLFICNIMHLSALICVHLLSPAFLGIHINSSFFLYALIGIPIYYSIILCIFLYFSAFICIHLHYLNSSAYTALIYIYINS